MLRAVKVDGLPSERVRSVALAESIPVIDAARGEWVKVPLVGNDASARNCTTIYFVRRGYEAVQRNGQIYVRVRQSNPSG